MSDVVVVGAGRMGQPIIGRLVSAGHEVAVRDIRPAARAAVQDAGATWLANLAAVRDGVAGADFVVTVLPGSAELRAVMLGTSGVDEGLLPTIGARTLWIDMTSTAPDLARELAERADTHAARYVDAAIGGGPADARHGRLTVYAGGSAEDVAAAGTVLQHLTMPGRIRHMGPSGTGYLTKLLINQLWFGQAVAMAEVVSLAAAQDVDPARFAGVVADSPADSAFVRDYLPRLLAGDVMPAFGLARIVEELDSLRRSASTAGVPWSASGAVADVHAAALARLGDVDGELLAAVDIVQASTGDPPPPGRAADDR